MVDLEAVRTHLVGVPKDQLPNARKIMREKWAFFLPIVVVFFTLLVLKTSTSRAAVLGIAATFIGPIFFSKSMKLSTKKVLDSVHGGSMGVLNIIAACTSAGEIIGVLAMTGRTPKVVNPYLKRCSVNMGCRISFILTMDLRLAMRHHYGE